MGFCLRFAETSKHLFDRIDSGTIDEPIYAFSMRGGWGIPDAGNWRLDPEHACGVTIESAPHNVDLLRRMCGEIEDATGHTRNVTEPSLENFDDNMVGTVSFDDGTIGLVQNTWTANHAYLRHGVFRTAGAVVLEGDTWWRHDRLIAARQDENHIRMIEFGPDTASDMGYAAETGVFLTALANSDTSPVTVADGCRAVEISHALLG